MTAPHPPAGSPATETAAAGPPTPSLVAAFPFLAPPRSAAELGRLGPYAVVGLLGQGGMGAVFRADDPALGRAVAVKVMLPRYAADPVARARFLREARAQAAVQHDHVVPVFQADEADGTPFITMPLLAGETLAAALKANPRPPLAEVLRVGREMAEGLAAAHARGLVHRDVKPGNVWLEGDRRRVKLLDFRLARAALDADPGTVAGEPLTTEGAIVGTPAYTSLEAVAGRATGTARGDGVRSAAPAAGVPVARPPSAPPRAVTAGRRRAGGIMPTPSTGAAASIPSDDGVTRRQAVAWVPADVVS